MSLARLLLQIAVILALCRLLHGILRHMGQPPVIGEIIAGLVLGPSVLGWLAPSWYAQLFPASSLPALNGLSQIGLVLFMFLVGLRLDLREVRAFSHVASLAGLFGVVALVLAAVGLYGVTAYSVAQRTNEIGIRMALGADRPKVIQLVLRGAFKRVLIGLILGLPLAIGAGRLLSAQLYGVSWWDPLALTVAVVALAICSFFAAIIPANRAASISPMNALRIE